MERKLIVATRISYPLYIAIKFKSLVVFQAKRYENNITIRRSNYKFTFSSFFDANRYFQ